MLTHTEAAAAVKTFSTEVVEMLLDLANIDRRNLVNRYVGADRTERIKRNDAVVDVLEAELAARRGLDTSDDLIAAIAASPDFVAVQDSAHLAYLLDMDEDETVPAHPNGWADIEAATAALKASAREENLTLSVYEAEALPKANTYEVGQRIIMVNLPYIGATVRSVDGIIVGIDYDNDGDMRGSHEALFSAIRPMPHH